MNTNNHNLKFIVTLIIAFFTGLCQISCQEQVVFNNTDMPELESLEIGRKVINPYRISGDKQVLDEKDAETIARNLEFNKCLTRASDIEREIESIYTINGDDEVPAMFVVNFSGNMGFTVVSAKKTYYPVLAEVERGNYSSDTIGYSIDEYIAEYKGILSNASSKLSREETIKIKNAWTRFEERIDLKESPMTKASSEDETLFWTLCDAWIANLESQGYEVYALLCYPEEMSTDTLQVLKTYAQNNINPNFNYLDHSFIVVSRTGINELIDPLISTKWSQDSPYRDYLPTGVVMGCGTIAMAQIMRFFEWLETYAWDVMPDTTASNNTKQFLYDLHYLTSNSIGGSIIDTIDVRFQSFGYNTVLSDYNIDSTRASINALRPVYMRGLDIYGSGGHAWVCCGQKVRNESLDCHLFVPISKPGLHRLIMYDVYSTEIGVEEPQYFYMNWGWAGDGNGWFLQSNVEVGSVNYASGRRMIYNISIQEP